MTAPTMSKPRLPQNLKWSDTWRPSVGADLVEGDREIPVDAATRVVAGWLMLCPIQPKDGEQPCRSEEWFFEKPKPRKFCPTHGQLLIEVGVDGAAADPVTSARGKLWNAAREALARRGDRAVTAATERAAELRAAVALAGDQVSRDMMKHRPSLYASGVALAAGLTCAAVDPLAAAAVGGVVATGGTLAAYATTWWWLSRKAEQPVVGRAARKIRERARHIGLGAAVFGAWLTGAGTLGVDVSTVGGSCTTAFVTLTGCALTWAVNRSHWETLWEDRRRLAELARMRAEAAARAAEEEAERLRRWRERQQSEVEETLEVIGQRMAAKWQEIARSETVPPGFLMDRTHIVPDRTREVMAPIGGVSTRIGYEYTIQAEPGALVARIGMGQPPIISVREWLAAMLERDPVTVATVDRPEGVPNTALLIVTDGAPLGGVVKWKGLDGIRRTADGAIYAHRGRSIKGDDVEEALYVPGQAGGSMVIGTTGGGKALALDTPIPTPNGWTTMGALRAGDQVFDEQGHTCSVMQAFDVRHGRPCYEVIFSDGSVIVADAEHLWKTTTQRGRWQQGNSRRGRPTRPFHRVDLDVEPLTTEQIRDTLTARRGDAQRPATNHAIDVCGPLDYPKRDLPIQPYTLGAWLGDGSSYGARICNPDVEVLDQIRADGYVVTDHAGPLSHGILTRQFVKGEPRPHGHRSFEALLREAGLLQNKHIPEVYLLASIDQRRALLAGLLDTDGMCGKDGQVGIDLCHRRLAHDVLDLVLGLGYRATMTTRQVKGRVAETSTCYRIKFVAPDPVFRLPRKGDRQRSVSPTSTSRRRYIVDVRPVASVPVRCIAVDSESHLFLAGRSCIPTHNSASNILAVLNRLAAGIFPILFDPKQLVDYGDFVGVFPIGVTDEHRDLILNFLVQERKRRERLVASKPLRDRHGRERHGESVWRMSDGPPIWHCWEEFHDLVLNEQFVARLTNHIRFQRVAAMAGTVLSQGGGLEDIGKSTLRGLLNQQELTTFRVDDHQARLAGRRDAGFNASDLPRLPGMCLILSPTAPPMPMRSAFVHREDRDGSVYDQLFAPDSTPLLQAPVLPQATLDVAESEGLMDLWRLAQGPAGMERLLSEAPTMYAGPVDVAIPTVGRIGAADVLLAIVVGNPGCDRKYIDSHVLWRTAPGWGKTPAPSTISRNASDLQKAGLLSRSDRNDGTDYRVTEKGLLRARSAADALSDKPRKAPQTEAEIEAAAERAAELAEEREK
jgi:hypothetical protein